MSCGCAVRPWSRRRHPQHTFLRLLAAFGLAAVSRPSSSIPSVTEPLFHSAWVHHRLCGSQPGHHARRYGIAGMLATEDDTKRAGTALEGREPKEMQGQLRPAQVEPQSPTQKQEEEEVDAWTYFFGKPGELQSDLAYYGVTPSVIVSVTAFSLAIGLASNLWGQTEFVFNTFPVAGQAAMDSRFDTIYAVQGLKRYYADEYSVRYPRDWLFDQRVQLAKISQLEGTSSAAGTLPDAAWGPAGGGQKSAKERENLSVVKQRLAPGPGGAPMQIEGILGEPEAALRRLLSENIAPENSGRSAKPLRAAVESRAGNTYYEFEWRTTFDKGGFSLRTFSSAALGPADQQGRRYLYTLTIVLPDTDSAASQSQVRADVPRILESFAVSAK